MEWEEIPDDVLVPTRTKRRRHRFREGFAPDVLLVGQTRRVRARVDDAFAALFTASDPRARGDGAARSSRARRVSTPRARPAESSWDGEWTADHASAAVAEAADRDPPDPVDVLAAHLSAGWTLRPPSQSTRDPTPLPDANDVDARTLELRPPRPDDRRDFYRKKDDDAFDRNLDGLAHLRLAHGLVNPPALVPDAHAHVRALSRLAGAISAARLCGVVLRARRWCAVAVREALAAAAAVDALVSKRSGPLRDERAARAAAALAHTARAALDEATTASREKGGGWDDETDDENDGENDDDSESASKSASESASDLFARAMAAMGGGGGRVGGGRSPSARDGRRQDEGGGGERRLGSQTPSDFFRARLASALDDAAHAVAYHARSCGWLDARVGVGFELASYATAVDAHRWTRRGVGGRGRRGRRECSNPLLAASRETREGARCSPPRRRRASPAATLEAANDAKTRANETRAAAPNPPPPPCAPAAAMARRVSRVAVLRVRLRRADGRRRRDARGGVRSVGGGWRGDGVLGVADARGGDGRRRGGLGSARMRAGERVPRRRRRVDRGCPRRDGDAAETARRGGFPSRAVLVLSAAERVRGVGGVGFAPRGGRANRRGGRGVGREHRGCEIRARALAVVSTRATTTSAAVGRHRARTHRVDAKGRRGG